MNDKEKTEYDSYVRGAATFVLVGQKNPLTAAELAQLFHLDVATVNADIDAIVQYERHKPGGVFEAT